MFFILIYFSEKIQHNIIFHQIYGDNDTSIIHYSYRIVYY